MAKEISIHFDNKTDILLQKYIEKHNLSEEEFIKQAVAKELEDWIDIQAADSSYQSWKKDDFKTKNWHDSLKELGLDDQ
ncbi:hypothetical protein COSHB9_07630 [Companilactobacillus alimentarius]|uniref:Uncharacterized protein n=1 Tax=Companilactobacillus alimentarius DSM 20249 TaxID=1423720 RepID=A0A2K9HMC7_9LACO|nr:DUF6290 family protein [Companilactobacillus alimentarius]AUI72295.1 hypothetical protein LA20249_08915 [Companilactobacillus alimentarius DSM 20249]MDT6952872.1 DUF6290 family protein [Companilactobacillus alimentarius]GEO45688.1 hypothetical protein LAL01_19200 [Companilactobacillus alimentarius]